ncbi:PKD domain-containing protein [Thalassotalea fonticola]|uniref:PKD domain-containing protein n=1 Tax=Thalassotalea fonticola TaxID=3065649 RepID=A0ABZ0GP30_9GAMM|nr:PKD domain-containing protein [Colwelliaceae bacterium S1-1]
MHQKSYISSISSILFPRIVVALSLLFLLSGTMVAMTVVEAASAGDINSIANDEASEKLFSTHPLYIRPSKYARAALIGNLNVKGLAQGKHKLRITLPNGKVVILQRSYLEKRGKGNSTWFGRVKGEANSEVVLTLKHGLIYGRIRIVNEVFELKSTRKKQLIVEQLDSQLFPERGDDTIRVPTSGDNSSSVNIPSAASSNDDGISTIDLLSVYSNDALNNAGSAEQVETIIQAAVDAANNAFVNSNISIRYRLVYTASVNYNTSGTTSNDLPWLRSDSQIAALRDQYGADMVSLIVDTSDSCGTGYVQQTPGSGFASFAFQVTDIDCAVGNLTFGHEHGHNLGMEHNPSNSSAYPENGSYLWSFGHYINGSYRTMMSYSDPCSSICPRAQQISNPNVIHNGYATGITNERDNARTGDLTGPISAAFREQVVPYDGSIVFAALGDFGDGSNAEADVASMVNDWLPDFIITAGDNRYGSDSYDEVVGQFYCNFLTDVSSGNFCDGGNSSINAFFPTLGNHDYSDGGGVDEYLSYFSLPGVGITTNNTSGSETYYDFVDGPVHFFALDSDLAWRNAANMNAQKSWLQALLATSISPWQVVYFHHGAYSSANHGSHPHMQWDFADWGVDAVISAHDHTYERIKQDDILYFVNGLGGRSLYSFGSPVAGSQVRYNGDHGAMRITASVEQMQFEFINRLGTVIDSHLLQPSVGNNNVVTTRIASSTDDVEQRSSDGSVDITDFDIELGDDPGSNEDQSVGLRFTALNIPQGASIISASLEFTVAEIDTATTNVSIRAQAADNAAEFVATTNNVTNRSLTNTSSSWNIAAWNTVGDVKQSTDISALVQEVINRNGWIAGNAMAFVVSGSGSRTAKSYDGDASAAPLLRIEYEVALPTSGSIDISVASASDDVEQKLSDGSMYFDSSDLELGSDESFNGEQSIGLRFRGIDIPQGAIIDSAYLEFIVDEANSGATDVEIRAQAVDNAPAFGTSDYDITNRVQTNNYVPWGILSWDNPGTAKPSPDISALVQEVVDRQGWNSGNNIVFFISGDGERTAESYDGAPASAPRLYIEYSQAPTNMAPIAAFIESCNDLNCSFTDTSTDNDGTLGSWSWEFGDGDISSAQNPSHSYASAGSYTVTLTVTDDDNSSNSTSQSVTVSAPANQAPSASFSISTADLTAAFTDSSTDIDGTIAAWSWDFGDGDISSAQNPSHSYASAGSYTVTLTVTDDDNSSNSTSQSVTVSEPGNQAPSASFSISTADLTATFTDSSTDSDGTIAAWSWDFGDANSATTQNPSHSYASAGSYTVTLTVTDDDNSSNSTSQSVTVSEPGNQAPSASFSISTADLTATFTDSSTDSDGTIAAWSWDFGDGDISSAQNPSHSYASAGSYTVTLTVTDDDNSSNSTSQSVTVSEPGNQAPSASFSISTADLTATFTDSSTDIDGTIAAWSWDFGDANSATTQNPSHSYASAGSYTVTLTVTDDDNSSNSTSQSVTVSAPANQAPSASFSISTADLTAAFTDSSTDIDGTIAAWSWDFGDGNSAATQNPSHSYASAGSYTVTLTVTDDDNSSNSTSQSVTVSAPANQAPSASFSISTADLTATFTDSSTDSDGTITAWSWDFGDANSATTQNPSHSYASAGSYTVTLTVTDDDNSSNSTSQSVTVSAPANQAPSASFSISTADLTATFTDSSTDIDGTIAAWSWDFGDANSATTQNPSHSYASAGSYTVTLTVTDDESASGSASQLVTVTAPIAQAPNAPTNLVALVEKSGKGKDKVVTSITLSWADNSNNETSFVIEACVNIGKGRSRVCDFVGVGSSGENVTSFADQILLGYDRFQVKAVNGVGSSAYSNQVKK